MEFNFDIKVNRDLKISLGNGAIFGDNINFYPSNTEEVTEVTDADFEEVIDEVRKENPPSNRSTSKGRPTECLFYTEEGEKDMERTKRMANLFKQFLEKEHLSALKITSSKSSPINISIFLFMKVWDKRKELCLKNVSVRATYRFLNEDCKIKTDVEIATYGNGLRDWFRSDYCDDKKMKEILSSTEYYKSAKPGSLAEKAGMVARYNEKNKKNTKK